MGPGDSVLTEEYTYAHVPESMFYPLQLKTIGLKMDSQGILPEFLEETLTALQAKGEPIPKVLYTIPVGQNPTGEYSFLRQLGHRLGACKLLHKPPCDSSKRFVHFYGCLPQWTAKKLFLP